MISFLDTAYADHLRGPEDFHVKEVVDPKFTRKFETRGGKVIPASGRYSLCLLKKKNRNTEDVLRELRKQLGIREVGHAGLKDKQAVTSQYITLKEVTPYAISAVKLTGASVKYLQHTSRSLSTGDLLGNRFTITLHHLPDPVAVKSRLEELQEHGVPNFFGPQRFGVQQNNHEIGRLLLQRQFQQAEHLHGGKLTKERAKFFIHAYQSWLFNHALARHMEERGTASIIGYAAQLPVSSIERTIWSLATAEGIEPHHFQIDKLRLRCDGTLRKTWVHPTDVQVSGNDPVTLRFFLPKGSYATTLLQQLFD